MRVRPCRAMPTAMTGDRGRRVCADQCLDQRRTGWHSSGTHWRLKHRTVAASSPQPLACSDIEGCAPVRSVLAYSSTCRSGSASGCTSRRRRQASAANVPPALSPATATKPVTGARNAGELAATPGPRRCPRPTPATAAPAPADDAARLRVRVRRRLSGAGCGGRGRVGDRPRPTRQFRSLPTPGSPGSPNSHCWNSPEPSGGTTCRTACWASYSLELAGDLLRSCCASSCSTRWGWPTPPSSRPPVGCHRAAPFTSWGRCCSTELTTAAGRSRPVGPRRPRGLVSTATDLLRFARALLSGGGDVLTAAAVTAMTTDHLSPEQRRAPSALAFLGGGGWGTACRCSPPSTTRPCGYRATAGAAGSAPSGTPGPTSAQPRCCSRRCSHRQRTDPRLHIGRRDDPQRPVQGMRCLRSAPRIPQ